MGAWGAGSFENDDAIDWVAELETDGVKHVRAALRAACKSRGYLEVDVGSAAMAAAEVVAASRGRPAKRLPADVAEWVAAHRGVFTAADVSMARQAVDRCASAQSELAELWREGGDAQWLKHVSDLRTRLA